MRATAGWITSLSIVAALAAPLLMRAEAPVGGRGPLPVVGRDEVADEAEMEEVLRDARTRLGAEGHYPEILPEAPPTFIFPLRAKNIGYFSSHGTSNYLDQNWNGGAVLDWNCGARTYDAHAGNDFFAWPYPWLTMQQNRLEIVAAAAGTIVGRVDGGNDQSCVQGTSGGNQIVLQHSDGSITGYLHMKNGSVTSKQVGQSVVQGEYLGVVGSSGGASGPHLHFGFYSDDTLQFVRDPFYGPCEAYTTSSFWASQPAYRQPRVNHLSTNSALPVIPACPGVETPNEKRLFATGDPIFFVAFMADETPAFQKTMTIRRPDGTVFNTWNHTTPQIYDAIWWYWTWASFPADQAGRWTFSVTINGTTKTRAFWIDTLFAEDFEDANLSAWSSSAP